MAVLITHVELHFPNLIPREHCLTWTKILKERAQNLKIGCGLCSLELEVTNLQGLIFTSMLSNKLCPKCKKDLRAFIES